MYYTTVTYFAGNDRRCSPYAALEKAISVGKERIILRLLPRGFIALGR
jgi:hypothetical protein